MSKDSNIVELKDGTKYEAEILTGITEESSTKMARFELWNYSSKKWFWSDEKEAYQTDSIKDRKSLALYNTLYDKLFVIMASDKNTIFESVESLVELARNNPDSFNKVYVAAIKANPTLANEPEKTPDPNL